MVRVRLLGGLALAAHDVVLAAPTSRRARALLAWLALHPGRQPRARVAAALWPDVLDESARASLRTALHELRAALGPHAAGALRADREWVELEAWVDVREVERLAGADRLEDALALARGELLPDLDLEWVFAARERHHERVLELLEQLAAAAEATGDLAGAVRFSRERVALDPVSEEAGRALIRRLALAGDRAAALRAFTALRDRLAAGLGIAPSPATRALVATLRADDDPRPANGPHALPAALARPREGRFVGRAVEVRRLLAAVDAVERGDRALALVNGEPGIGKTRLLQELGRAAQARGLVVLYGRCHPEPLRPYEPVAEALRPLNDPAAEPVGIPPAGAGDSAAARWRLFEAVDELVVRASQAAPVLLALDDVHWADRSTLVLATHLLRSAVPARLLLVWAYRDTGLPADHPLALTLADLRRDAPPPRVTLGGLGEEEVAALVRDRVGGEAPGELARAVHAETAGNPFYVEEVLRHLSESGAFARPTALWPAAMRVSAFGIPASVREVIGARLAMLGEDVARVLAAAAVTGLDFRIDVLERLEPLARVDVLAALETAQLAGMIREEPEVPGGYGFVHPLVREAVYDGMGRTRRARLHGAVAAALTASSADDLEPHLAALAHHHLEAGSPDAVEHVVRAAAAASARLAYEQAAALYERALAALPPGPKEGPRRRELLLELGEARLRAGDRQAAREAFLEAAALARRDGASEALARAALGFSGLGVTIIAVDEPAVALLEEALAALPPARPGSRAAALRARLLARLAIETYYGEPPDRRKARGDQAVQAARTAGEAGALLDALEARHVALWSPAFLVERLDTAHELVARAERLGDRERAMHARNWLVLDLAEAGDLDAMRDQIATHERLAEELRLPAFRWWGPMWRATLAMLEGRWRDAEALIEHVEELARRHGDPNAALYAEIQRFHLALERERPGEIPDAMLLRELGRPAEPAYRAGFAWLYAAQGRLAEAREHVEWLARDDFARIPEDVNRLATLAELTQALVLLDAPRHAPRVYELLRPYADRLVVNARAASSYGVVAHHLGALAALAGRLEAATIHLEDAVRRHADLGARPWLARSQAALGRLLVEQGGADAASRARDLLAAAATGGRELGLDGLAARAAAAAAAHASPTAS